MDIGRRRREGTEGSRTAQRPLAVPDTCSDYRTTLRPASGDVRETVDCDVGRYYLRVSGREELALAQEMNKNSDGQLLLEVLKTTRPRCTRREELVSDDVVCEEALD